MKKFKVAPQTAKRMKAIIAATMALTMAVPTSVYFSSKEATAQAEESVAIPDPIMSVDFEKGFKGESKEHGLSVVRSENVLKFKEYRDAKGDYIRDPETKKIIFKMTDLPAIQGGDYVRNVVGNQPLTAYDDVHGSVLMLDDTVKIPEFKKKDSDELDSKYPIGTELQKAYTAQSQVKLNNPFAGRKLTKENEYGKGVTMSYWVKVPSSKAADGTSVASDSSLLVFNNTKRVVMDKDDLAKYRACLAYDEAKDKNDTAVLADYSMGTQKIVTDVNDPTKTYTLYQNYGKLIRLNPDYPLDTEATVKGAWYAPARPSDAKVQAKDAEGNIYGISSFASGGLAEDEGQYQYYRYRYASQDDKANGYSSKSMIREGRIEGSMQISANNYFNFREDSEGSGTLIENPNRNDNGKLFTPYKDNQFYFEGEKTVTSAPDVWHYITVVVQNDWVDIYVDGNKIDAETQFKYWGGEFNSGNAGKIFNQGKGLRGIFKNPKQPTDWDVEGRLVSTPGNTLAITILDWLTDENTELFIGGNGVASVKVGQEIGTTFGTCIDGLKFFDEPLSEKQAVQLYNNAVAETTKDDSNVPDPVARFTFDDNSMTSTNGSYTMNRVDTNIPEKDPSVMIDEKRGYVLKNEDGKTSGTSAMALSENPFAGKDLTGASVSYWVKMPKAAVSTTVSFMDTPKVMEHEKISAGYGHKASSILAVDTASVAKFEEGYTDADVYQGLKNKFLFSVKKNDFGDPENAAEKGVLFDEDAKAKDTEYRNRLIASTEWHFVTVVFNNYEIKFFYDGQQLSNNLMDENGNRACFGPRFFDGYYQRMWDGFKDYYASSNNQMATPLMTFLTDKTTTAYIGYQTKYGSASVFERQSETYFDNIAYYDVALTANQAKALYEKEVNEENTTPQPTPTPAPTKDPDNGNNGNNNIGESPIIVKGGMLESSFGGVTFKAKEGVIPSDAKMTLGRLGTEDSADIYNSFRTKLAEIKEFAVKDFVVYTATAKDVNGAAISANGEFQLTFDIPSGYDAKSVVVVGEDGKIYEGTISEDGTKITITTNKFGNYAVVQKDMSTDDGSTVASASSAAGKTGDTANVVIPFVILALAGATLVVTYKKRAFQK